MDIDKLFHYSYPLINLEFNKQFVIRVNIKRRFLKIKPSCPLKEIKIRGGINWGNREEFDTTRNETN